MPRYNNHKKTNRYTQEFKSKAVLLIIGDVPQEEFEDRYRQRDGFLFVAEKIKEV